MSFRGCTSLLSASLMLWLCRYIPLRSNLYSEQIIHPHPTGLVDYFRGRPFGGFPCRIVLFLKQDRKRTCPLQVLLPVVIALRSIPSFAVTNVSSCGLAARSIFSLSMGLPGSCSKLRSPII